MKGGGRGHCAGTKKDDLSGVSCYISLYILIIFLSGILLRRGMKKKLATWMWFASHDISQMIAHFQRKCAETENHGLF